MIPNHCTLRLQWGLDPELATRLLRMQEVFRANTPLNLQIISGFRTCEEQEQLAREGRPAAPCELSTHVACPATGADLRILGSFPGQNQKQAFGAAAATAGLRWGGGSSRDESGIPSDWNHVDLGPRQDQVAQAYREGLTA